MQVVGVVVEHIDNYELRLSDLLRDLGRRHHTITPWWLMYVCIYLFIQVFILFISCLFLYSFS